MGQIEPVLINELLDSSYAPVLALTVLNAVETPRFEEINRSSSILVGVRDPETNSTHPNVLSVPTKRVPEDVLGRIEVEIIKEDSVGASNTYILKELDPDPRANGHNNLFFAVKSILAEKLGLSEQLELGEVSFRTRLEAIVLGTVRHPEFEEKTCMYNAVVLLSGASHVPDYTSSYRSLIWCPVDKFIRAAETKDLTAISIELSPFEYCMHGLCVMSSFNVLSARCGGRPYPFDEQEL